MSKCRACLKSVRNMIPFTEKYIMYFNILTDLNLKLLHEDPKHLCKHCFKILQQFIEFREKCIAANAMFRDISSESIKKEITFDANHCVLDVKQELKEDDKRFFENNVADGYYVGGDNELNYDNGSTYELVLKTEEENRCRDIVQPTIKSKNAMNACNDFKKRKVLKKSKSKTKRENMLTKKLSGQKAKSDDIITVKSRGKILFDKTVTGLPCGKSKLFSLTDQDELPPYQTSEDAHIGESTVYIWLLGTGLCSKSFEDNTQLCLHLSTHLKCTSCPICEERLVDWQEVLSHRLYHLPRGKFSCHLCTKKYISAIYMDYHFRIEHHTEGERQKLRCRMCDRLFSTPLRINFHKVETHNILNKKFYCDYCNKLCTTKSTLKAHLVTHLDTKQFRCDLCSFTTKSLNYVRIHKKTVHNPNRVDCGKCKQVCASQAQLDRHECSHSDCICPVCGKLYQNRGSFRRHVRGHDAATWYACARCPARFRSGGALAVHRDKHDGVKRHACSFCPAKFYSPSVLVKHRRVHTGIKPYVCKICGKGFTGNNNLKVHMKVHGKFLVQKKDRNDEKMRLEQIACLGSSRYLLERVVATDQQRTS